MRMCRLVALFVLAATAPATAQDRGCTFDTARHRDTVTVVLSLGPATDKAANRQANYLSTALAIADFIRTPPTLAVASWPGTYFGGEQDGQVVTTEFGLGGFLVFTVNEAGRLKGGVQSTSESQTLNAALIRAVRSADSAGRLPPFPGDLYPPDGHIRLRIDERLTPTAYGVAFTQVRFPALRIDTAAMLIKAGPLKYPEVFRRDGRRGRVVFRMIINEAGSVDQQSIRIVEATAMEFVTAAEDAIVLTRYRPAHIAGCPVRSLVQQTVMFGSR